MGLFSNNQPTTQRAVFENRERSARMSLLLVVVFSAINAVLALLEQDLYFLFSATMPYFLAITSSLCFGNFQGVLPGIEIMVDPSLGYIFIAIAVILIALYLISFILSKKNTGWLVVALVMFSIDTVFMFLLYGINVEMLFDIVFHAWVIISLALGVHAKSKLKDMPEEQPSPFIFNTEPNPFAGQTSGETESTSDEAPVEAAAETAVDETSTEEVSADVTEDSANEVE